MWLVPASNHSFVDRMGTDRQQMQRCKYPQTCCLTTRVSFCNTIQVTLDEVRFL